MTFNQSLRISFSFAAETGLYTVENEISLKFKYSMFGKMDFMYTVCILFNSSCVCVSPLYAVIKRAEGRVDSRSFCFISFYNSMCPMGSIVTYVCVTWCSCVCVCAPLLHMTEISSSFVAMLSLLANAG